MIRQKSRIRPLALIAATLAMSAVFLTQSQPVTPTVAQDATATVQATRTPGGTPRSVSPGQPTATPVIRVARTPVPGATVVIGGTPVATQPGKISPPATLEELLQQFPELQVFLDANQNATYADMDMAGLYEQLVRIYNQRGISGVSAFLDESGLLDKLGIPVSYLDLLTAYDRGGWDAVIKLARDRQIINSADEIVAYLALEDGTDIAAVRTELDDLGVSHYGFDLNMQELQIGVPIVIIAQSSTPGPIIKYLAEIANIPGVVGFRAPVPRVTNGKMQRGFESVGAETVGADKWHEAGITGQGIKVGVIDLGFGGILDLAGETLPERSKINSYQDLDELNDMQENHGTACAQVVTGMAPDIELYVAAIDSGSNSFLDALEYMRESGVKVINYSVGLNIGPRDGTFEDSVIVDEFVRETGILFVAAAGNNATSHTMFEFKEGDDGYHAFGDSDQTSMPFVTGAPFTQVTLNWDGNWQGREKSQYNLVILDADGEEVASASDVRKGRRNDLPYQALNFESTPGAVYYLAVEHKRGSDDNTLDIFINNALLPEWAQVPEYSVSLPADADAVLTVGATGLTRDRLEEYSSQGPTTDERLKPDITAPTGEKLPDETRGFFGTSGAAPLITGAAALVFQAYPDLSQAEVQAYLTENVVDLGKKGADTQFGAGRLALPAPEGIDPENPDNDPPTEEQVAAFSDFTVKYNVKVKGQTGTQFKMTFSLKNYQAKTLAVAVVTTDRSGNDIPSADPKFELGGTIASASIVNVKKKQSTFKNVTVFIPNSAFEDVTEDEIQFTAILFDFSDQENPVVLATSEPITAKLE